MTVPTPTYTDGDWGYDTFTEDGTTYARVVSYSGTGGSGVTITIPNTLGGYVVKEVGKGGSQETIFNNNTVSMNTILGPIPSTVTAINNYAFYNGIKVKMNLGQVLPNNLVTIGNYAFYNGQSYSGDLKMPDTVTTIGDYAFQSGSCTSIEISAGIQSIGTNAFYMCSGVTNVKFKCISAPTLGSGCFGLNSDSPSATTKNYPVQSPNNWASSVLNSYKNTKTTFTFSALPMFEHLMLRGNKIQVDSAIRDGNGVKIDTNYQRTLVSGTNIKTINNESLLGSGNITVGGSQPQVIEYTVPTTVSSGSYRVIAEYDGTYDGSPGYVKFAMEVTSSSYTGIYVIEATWGQANGGITLLSGNATSSDAGYASLHYPSNTSNYAYPPLLAVYNGSTREKQVKITILESSNDLTWKTDWNTEVSTTGRSNQNLGLYYKSQVNYATSASSASSATSSTITTEQRKSRFIGETAQLYSLCGVATDGKVYRLLSIPSSYHLALPARLTSNYTNGSSANQSIATRDSYNSALAYSYLANSTYQGGSGYTCPTLTTSDGGRVLYVRGSLVTDTVNGVSSVNFVPDGNITLSMAPGYTYIPFGEVYRSSASSAPSYFYWKFESTPAYTIDSNGKLTHIDGKPISNGITVSSSAPSGGNDGDIWIQY